MLSIDNSRQKGQVSLGAYFKFSGVRGLELATDVRKAICDFLEVLVSWVFEQGIVRTEGTHEFMGSFDLACWSMAKICQISVSSRRDAIAINGKKLLRS
eukprot:c12033_g1_i1 orf=177-473(-)